MAKVLFGFTQDLFLVLEVIAFHFGLKTKYFSLGKCLLNISLKFCTMAFGITLCHFQQFLLAMALVQILSPNPSLTFGSWFASNPASWTSPCDHFLLNFFQTNFCLLFYLLDIYKGTPFSVWIFTTKLLSPPSPLNPQPGTMKIH